MNIKNSFLSYIKKSIEFKSLDYKKKYYKLKKSEYYVSNLNILLENKNAFIDYLPSISSNINDKDIIDFFDDFMKRNLFYKIKDLTLLQKKIIYKIYIEDISERAIAKELNTSYQNINNIKKTALNKLNRYYKKNNI